MRSFFTPLLPTMYTITDAGVALANGISEWLSCSMVDATLVVRNNVPGLNFQSPEQKLAFEFFATFD